MKVIELTDPTLHLSELLELARREILILRRADNENFVLAPLDEFSLEVELLKNNKQFMQYLDRLFSEQATVPLEDVEEELNI